MMRPHRRVHWHPPAAAIQNLYSTESIIGNTLVTREHAAGSRP
jgi:hypothetical protein